MLVPPWGEGYSLEETGGLVGSRGVVVGVLTEFELDLAKVPGVKSARVVGDAEPSEIHIVASSERSAKQLVRDVQSLAKAGYKLAIDHRIVSVVQLEDTPASQNGNGTSKSSRSRALISYIIIVNDAYGRRVDLGVEWPDGTTSASVAQLGESKQARSRAGADVMVQAVNEKVKDRGMSIDLDQVYVVGGSDPSETVTVRLVLHEGGRNQTLVGSANSDGDVIAGAARATLHALNRKLSEV